MNTHKWICYLRGVNNEDLSYLFKKVVFYLHSSFQNPVRCTFCIIRRTLPATLWNSGTGMGRVRNNDRGPLQSPNSTTNPNPTHVKITPFTSRRRPSVKETIVLISLRRGSIYVNGWPFVKDLTKKSINGGQGNHNRRTSIREWFRRYRSAIEIDYPVYTFIDDHLTRRSQEQARGGFEIYQGRDFGSIG